MRTTHRVLTGWVAPLCLGAILGGGIAAVRSAVCTPADRGTVGNQSVAPEHDGIERSLTQQHSSIRVKSATRATRASEDESVEELVDVLADINELEQRLASLTETPDNDCSGTGACGSVFEPTQQALDRWADCAQLPVDLPAKISGPTSPSSPWFSSTALDAIDASESEREELELAAEDFSRTLHARLAAIHEHVIGENDAGARPTHVLLSDLRAMQGVVDEDAEQRRRVALERAGRTAEGMGESGELVPFYRQLVELGDEFESAAASVVGRERARAIRAAQGGWGSRIDNPPRCRDEQTG